MPINHKLLEDKVASHNNTRNNFINSKEDKVEAAILFDKNQPITTNRKQLSYIGIDCSNVYENFEEVVAGLYLIGVVVVSGPLSKRKNAEVLSVALDEEVREAWRNENMQEFIELR